MTFFRIFLVILAVSFLTAATSAQLIGSGATDATFNDFVDGLGNPIPQNANIIVRGTSTNEVFFQQLFTGADQPNNILFEGVEFQEVAAGEPFLLGYVTYTNGQWILGPLSMPLRSFVAPMEIDTTAGLGVDVFFNQLLEDTLVLAITDNQGMTPEQAADIIYFENRPDLGSLRVFENQAATIEIYGIFGSLGLHSFGDVVSNPGSGFFFPTQETIPANFTPSSTGNGTRPAAPLIPEPATITMLAIACVGLQNQLRRCRKNRH